MWLYIYNSKNQDSFSSNEDVEVSLEFLPILNYMFMEINQSIKTKGAVDASVFGIQ